MKKGLKIALKTVGVVLVIVLLNEFYYLFSGQFKSTDKLKAGQELSTYEMVSIYSLHSTMWMLGWTIAPEAAKECMYLHFSKKDTVYFSRFNFSKSEKLKKAGSELMDKPFGSTVRLSWNGNVDYSPFSGEHRLAIAANPCILKKEAHIDYQHAYDEDLYTLTTSTLYPEYSRTEFDFKKFKLVINEGLFRYLQDKGWLGSYTAVYKIYLTSPMQESPL